MSATLVKMGDGSPPAEVNIPMDSDTLHTVIRDDSDVRKMDGEVYHEPTSVMFGRVNVR